MFERIFYYRKHYINNRILYFPSTSDETLTGVGASLVEKQNVIFVGTASGRLHALLVEEKHYSRTFHSVLLERGVRILPQIFVHDTATTEKYLIVASLYKVGLLTKADHKLSRTD